MTTRVFDCERRPIEPPPLKMQRANPEPGPSVGGLLAAALVALPLVPVAGAAEPPDGWKVAGGTAVTLLCLATVLGRRLRWGWLGVAAAAAGVVVPRGQLGVIGPALLVASVVCLVLWWANHRDSRRPTKSDSDLRAREHAAQLMMGLSGERRTGEVLARELPPEYVLINGLKLPRAAGDIDHLVIGPTGVFLIETKTMAGRIVCQPDGTWRRTRVGRGGTPYVAFIGNPAAQVQRNIFALRECLRRRVPHLFSGTPLWIDGLVVFPHPRTELAAEHSRVPALLLQDTTSTICFHRPQRWLQPADIDMVAQALLDETAVHARMRQSAQALVELALLLPVALALVFGTIALSRLVQTQTAVIAVAHETARAGALGRSPQDAVIRMRERMALVARGLGLNPSDLILDWDLTRFGQDPGQVLAVVRYPLAYDDLPFGGWIPLVTVRAEHVEWVDPFRSGVSPMTAAMD
jgi:membrane protein implicated in regulation of membrane protease activity